MDKSERYIKMCEKATEIQNSWEPSVGDWFLHDWHGTTGMGEKIKDKLWLKIEMWENIECLTYKPSIDNYIGISESNGTHGLYTSSSLLKDRHIWIPSQDQLQEMYGDFDKCISGLYWWKESGKIVSSDGDDYFEYDTTAFSTMEQLWLAFVMKEKYNKVWSGEDWN